MRGQNTIIRMRQAGYRPARVWAFVLQNPCETGYFRDAENVITYGGRAEVHIGSDEPAGLLDLRALGGLEVLLQGVDRDRVRAVFGRLKTFNPARVIVSGPDFFYDYQPTEATA